MEKGSHVLVFPFPVQGHINPMLQFSKRLAAKGLTVTFITTHSTQYTTDFASGSIQIQTQPIYDGFEPGEKKPDIEEFFERFTVAVSHSLLEFLESQIESSNSNPPKFLIYDSAMPWALQIAHKCGFKGSPFFTPSCAVSAIYCHTYQGLIKLPLELDGVSSDLSFPGLPLLGLEDLPSFVQDVSLYPSLLKWVSRRFSNVDEADCLFLNTFDELENEVVNWMRSKWRVMTIGPTLPSMYLDKRLEDDKDYGLSLFKPDSATCMNWLDTKEKDSVVYVAFGSLAALAQEQMQEIALALQQGNFNYLWVVRDFKDSELFGDREGISGKGLMVDWCPQLDVLSHPAIGCFVTHCGWNSTLEALSFGVPMVALPQWTDQPMNAKYIADVWQVGVRARVDEKRIVRRDEIELCLKEVMLGGRASVFKSNAIKWMKLAREAVDEGGSSDRNIADFVAKVMCI